MGLSVTDVNDIPEQESITDEEARNRFRGLALDQPDFNFFILEALMDHLEIPKETQREIIEEGVRKWQV